MDRVKKGRAPQALCFSLLKGAISEVGIWTETISKYIKSF
jgi:hypothetical protein